MPRRSRIAFAGYPHHLVQRGHNRSAVFFSDFDRFDYLGTLQECREMYSLKVYGYCLMTNHVHLIVDPGTHAQSLSSLMKRLAGRHTRRMNRLLQKTGTVWEGRFHCSPIDTNRYLLTCGRYVRFGQASWLSPRISSGRAIVREPVSTPANGWMKIRR